MAVLTECTLCYKYIAVICWKPKKPSTFKANLVAVSKTKLYYTKIYCLGIRPIRFLNV